jgi:hypothetical protein
MAAFSSDGHRGSVAPTRARRLVAGPFILGQMRGVGGPYIAYFVANGAIDMSPPAPADIQVTHTTPTRRSALYVPLFVLLGFWGTWCRRRHRHRHFRIAG